MLQTRLAWGHSAFVLNEHLSTTGVVDQSKSDDTFVVDERSYDPSFRDGRDAYHLTQGGALGRVHKGLGYLSLRGRLEVPDLSQQARLADREIAFRGAFDPDLCSRDSPTTDGAYALAWSEPSGDATNFASGWRPMQFFCRPAAAPTIVERLNDRAVRNWTLGLVGADPRFYGQTEVTRVLTGGAPSGPLANVGTVKSPLKVTIVTSGNGSGAFTLTRAGVSFVLDLSAIGGAATITVVMETCGPYGRGRYVLNGASDWFSIKTSSAATWLDVPVGSTSFAMTNTANVTSCTLATYPAWA